MATLKKYKPGSDAGTGYFVHQQINGRNTTLQTLSITDSLFRSLNYTDPGYHPGRGTPLPNDLFWALYNAQLIEFSGSTNADAAAAHLADIDTLDESAPPLTADLQRRLTDFLHEYNHLSDAQYAELRALITDDIWTTAVPDTPELDSLFPNDETSSEVRLHPDADCDDVFGSGTYYQEKAETEAIRTRIGGDYIFAVGPDTTLGDADYSVMDSVSEWVSDNRHRLYTNGLNPSLFAELEGELHITGSTAATIAAALLHQLEALRRDLQTIVEEIGMIVVLQNVYLQENRTAFDFAIGPSDPIRHIDGAGPSPSTPSGIHLLEVADGVLSMWLALTDWEAPLRNLISEQASLYGEVMDTLQAFDIEEPHPLFKINYDHVDEPFITPPDV